MYYKMKKLKLNHNLAESILKGLTSSTWRLFDDKDLAVNDQVVLVDKVNSRDPKTWVDIGVATIDNIIQKRLKDITQDDLKEHKGFTTKGEILKMSGILWPRCDLANTHQIYSFYFLLPMLQSSLLKYCRK